MKRTVRSGPRGPGGTPRELARSGSGALTFDPQSKAELAQGEYKEQGKYWHDTYIQPGRGVARRGAEDPTDDPAELGVGCALLMTFDGTCLRTWGGSNEHPREMSNEGGSPTV
jgi:hypothetical protein